MAINRQKLKLLYLMRMLEEETDAEQGLTMAQILERLEAQGITNFINVKSNVLETLKFYLKEMGI